MEIADLYGSAPRSGRGGRRFKSCHSDHDLAEISRQSATPCEQPRFLVWTCARCRSRMGERCVRGYVRMMPQAGAHNDPAPIGTGFYTVPEAARLLKIPALNIGRRFATGRYFAGWLLPHSH
jgi:hypothetical protein